MDRGGVRHFPYPTVFRIIVAMGGRDLSQELFHRIIEVLAQTKLEPTSGHPGPTDTSPRELEVFHVSVESCHLYSSGGNTSFTRSPRNFAARSISSKPQGLEPFSLRESALLVILSLAASTCSW